MEPGHPGGAQKRVVAGWEESDRALARVGIVFALAVAQKFRIKGVLPATA